jgi:hypothetical protein
MVALMIVDQLIVIIVATPKPHYYVGKTKMSERVEADQMTQEEIDAYWAGFEHNESLGDYKDYG